MQCFADRRWLCLTQLNSAWLILTQIDPFELLYFWIESVASVRQIIVQILLKFLLFYTEKDTQTSFMWDLTG